MEALNRRISFQQWPMRINCKTELIIQIAVLQLNKGDKQEDKFVPDGILRLEAVLFPDNNRRNTLRIIEETPLEVLANSLDQWEDSRDRLELKCKQEEELHSLSQEVLRVEVHDSQVPDQEDNNSNIRTTRAIYHNLQVLGHNLFPLFSLNRFLNHNKESLFQDKSR